MAFKTIPGIKGKVFVPEEVHLHHRKHPCPDCYTCQHCGDDRCRLCRTAECMPPQTATRPDADRPPAGCERCGCQ